MPLETPLTLGPFKVDREGRLAPVTPGRFPAFRVQWGRQHVSVRLAPGEADRGTLVLEAVLGQVPSTGTVKAPATVARETAFAALRAVPQTLPAGWRIALRPDHRVAMEARTGIDLPTCAGSLLTEVTLFLLRLGPYLELLAELLAFEAAPVAAGRAASDGAAAGKAKTCPG